MFYNKALIDKYNYEDPYKLWKAKKWNWDKFIEMCEDAKDDGMAFGAVGEGHSNSYIQSYGVTNLYYDGKKIASNWNSSNWLKVHQIIGDLYWKDTLLGRGREVVFDAGEVVFYVGTTVHARNKNSYFGDLKANKTLYFVPIPEHKELGKYYQGYGEIEAYGIPKGAKNPEAVPYFLRYFLDGANYALDSYFGNKQNLEVYNWCMNQPNKIISYGYESPDVVGEGTVTSIELCTGAQMKNFIDANKGVNDKWVKEQNEILNKLK
jgi:ABC-type glycerol-3-phosphate transport system substrate-binding protein